MKVSYNWLKTYMSFDHTPEEIADILTEIGLEVEGAETVESVKGGLAGITIGEVLTCERHPNADRLSLTTVDVGAEAPLQIVCGAPNVAAGQRVVVAPVGTTLYPEQGEPLKIKKGKIRGEVSEGMICAEDEIGLGASHDGIMVLTEEAKVGQSASSYFGIESDTVFEVGLTPNRPDAICHLGVAKDLHAALRTNYQYTGTFRQPVANKIEESKEHENFDVEVKNAGACPRYSGVIIKDIVNGSSPEWLKKRLKSIGVKSINTVVDITNYILHEYGQPLHAFDLAKIEGNGIIVQTLEEGNPFVSLDGEERKLSATDLMICDKAGNPMCIAGVYGGLNSGVSEQTTAIFLESAHFEQQWIRRTSMKHQLRTDAAKVYEKGSDPNICVEALSKATELIVEMTGARVSSQLFDLYPTPVQKAQVEVSYAQVENLIGVEIPQSVLMDILTALEMEVIERDESGFTVSVPTNKPDVLRPADVIEEITRIYGFGKIPLPSRMQLSTQIGNAVDQRQMEDKVAQLLVANGFYEMMGLSMMTKDYVPQYVAEEQLVFVNNTSNVQLEIMRPTMISTALQALDYNFNRQQRDLKLFEYGHTYLKQDDRYIEEKHLSICMTGIYQKSSWLAEELPISYHSLRAIAELVMKTLGIETYQLSELNNDPAFRYGQQIHRGNQVFAKMGCLNLVQFPNMQHKAEVFFVDFDWDKLMLNKRKKPKELSALSKFPTVSRDLSLLVKKSTRYEDIEKILWKSTKPILKSLSLTDIYENVEQLGRDNASYTINLLFENPNKTLTDKEIDKKIDQAITLLANNLDVKLRS